MIPSKSQCPRQRGAALVIALIMLLVLTILGLAGMNSTILEEKMAGNLQNQSMAFQAAEAALRGGESWLFQLVSEPALVNASGSSCTSNCQNVWQLGSGLSVSDAKAQQYSGTLGVQTAPLFIAESDSSMYIRDSLVRGRQQDEGGRMVYRVTARGTGSTDEAQARLQSFYTRRF